jgi:hypothetical protein
VLSHINVKKGKGKQIIISKSICNGNNKANFLSKPASYNITKFISHVWVEVFEKPTYQKK